MINFQQNRKKIIYSKPFLLLMLCFLIFLIYGVFNVYQKMSFNKENRKITEEKVLELEERKKNLIYEIENLNTEKGQEKIFRENMGLAKEGEGVLVIVEEEYKEPEIESKKGFMPFVKKIFSKPNP